MGPFLIRMHVIANEQLVTVQTSVQSSLTLDTYQLAAVQHIDRAVGLREQFHSNDQSLNSDPYFSDSHNDSDGASESDHFDHVHDHTDMQDIETAHNFITSDMPDIQWQKPILVIGKAGAGNTEATCQSVLKHVQEGKKHTCCSSNWFPCESI